MGAGASHAGRPHLPVMSRSQLGSGMIAKDFPLIRGKSFAKRKSFAIMTRRSRRAGPAGIARLLNRRHALCR
jgi:hypothetical protein